MSSASRLCAALVVLVVLAAPLPAQMPGVPVLQNAFSNPGLTAGANVGSSDAGAAYGAALSYAPGSGRFQVSGGIGVHTYKALEIKSTPTYGVRGAYALPWPGGGNGSFGTAAFVGFGGATSDDIRISTIPVGAAVSYRRALGATRAVSVYATPFYEWVRTTLGDADEVSESRFAASLGADVTVMPRLGATIGYQFGLGGGGSGEDGRSKSAFGLGVSWAFR